MFTNCYELESLDLSNFDTSNVTDMSFIFNGCFILKEIKGLKKFITNNVTNMSAMFKCCCKLKSLDLSNFDTSNVTDMSSMFFGCNNLKEIKGLNKFITNKVIKMNSMFQGCIELESLDLSNFDTKKVTEINNIFKCCECDLIFKYHTLKGCDEKILNQEVKEELKQNDKFQMEEKFIAEILKDKSNKNANLDRKYVECMIT